MGICSAKKKKPQVDKKKQLTEGVWNKTFVRIITDSSNKFYQVQTLLQDDKGTAGGGVNKVKKLDGERAGEYFIRKQIKKAAIKQTEKEQQNQIEIIGSLNHPNIIELYQIYEDPFNYYLIIPFCSGGELLDKIISWHNKKDQFTEQKAAKYMKQILSAINYCHNKKIVHRDLKPENLLLDGTDQIKINGFGIAREFSIEEYMHKPIGTPYYMAPEVLNKYIGIILYVMFTGKPPFLGKKQQIIEQIKEKEIQYDSYFCIIVNCLEMQFISKPGINFLQKLLERDPTKRYSASEALSDPWIVKEVPNTPLNQDIFKRLSEFQQENKIKHAILMYISTQILNPEEKKEYIDAFKALDKDNNGTISKEELLIEFKKKDPNLPTELAEAEVEKILQKIGTDLQGMININEFITACIQSKNQISKERIKQMFKQFDLDGNGKITRDEFETILGGIFSEENWQEILQECDKNNDGEIDCDEFVNLLSNSVLFKA